MSHLALERMEGRSMLALTAPSITSINDDVAPVAGVLISGQSTNDTDLIVRVDITGIGAAVDNVVKLYNGANPLGSSQALTLTDLTSKYVDIQTQQLTDGTTYAITAKWNDGTEDSPASPPFSVSVDTTAPGVTIAPDKANLTGTDSALITFTLSEASTTFALEDIEATGGTLGDFQAVPSSAPANTKYTARFTPTASFSGPAFITVKATSFSDAAGNLNTAATSASVVVNAPTVVITSSATSLATGQTALITFTLSKPSTTFDEADVGNGISETGGTLSSFTLVSPTVYTAIFTPDSSSTVPGGVSVAAGTFTDLLGSENLAAGLASPITIDTVVPTVSVTTSKPSLRSGETATITFTLGKASGNFAVTDVVVSGGTLSAFAGSGTGYSATFTPAANSTTDGMITVPAGAFTDAAGNANTAGILSQAITIDTVAPTVSITSDKPSLKSGETATITFTLSESSTTFTASDVVITGGTLSAFAGSGASYTATFTPTPNSTVNGTIAVPAGTFTDSAGNASTAASSLTLAINTVAPTVTIESDKTTLKSGETAVIKFTLSKPSTDFVAADMTPGKISATGGTLSSFTLVSSTVYTAIFTPDSSSTVPGSVSVAAGTFTDLNGSDNLAAGLASPIAIDTVFPSVVSITSDKLSLKSGETATISFELSEPSTTFVAGDVAVSGGTLSGFAGSGTGYTAIFTPTPNSTASGSVTVLAGVFTDTAGNANAAATPRTLTIDTVAPTVTITSDKPSLKSGETAIIYFTLSEPSSTFATGDATASGGTLSAITGSGTSYTANFTPASSSTAPGTITVPAGTFTDTAGNANTAASPVTLAIDTVAPTVAIKSDKTSLKSGETAVITFTLAPNDPSTTFTDSDIGVGLRATGGDLSGFTSVSPTVYTAIFTPTLDSTVAGQIRVLATTFTDAAGNGNLEAILTPSILIDTITPFVGITSDATSKLGGTQTATITFTLSKPSTTFVASDVAVSGGTLTAFQGSGASYNAIFTPTPNFAGSGSVTVLAGVFTDLPGNVNAVATTLTIAIDTIAPTVSITNDPASLKGGTTATITFTLSKPSTNFSLDDVNATNGTLSNWTDSTATSYTARFTPTANFTGAATVTVDANKFSDAYGNVNRATSTRSFPVNTASPTVTITNKTSDLLAAGKTAVISFSLSAESTDFTKDDVLVSGGSISNFAATSAKEYTALFTPASSATTGLITVAAGNFNDLAGNPNLPGALAKPIEIDAVKPTVTIDVFPSTSAVSSTRPATVVFTLSEPSTDFAAGDVVVTGGTLSLFNGSRNLYSATFRPFPDSTTPGSVTVPAGAFTDAAGNDNALVSKSIPVDSVAPRIQITTNKSNVGAGQTSTITFTLSEPSTDFTGFIVTLRESTSGTLSTVTGSGTTYTATFTPAVGYVGTATIEVLAETFTDLAGNQSANNGQLVLGVNTKAPTVSITTPSLTLKDGETALIRFTLSAESTDFVMFDATPVGGALSNFRAISPKEYTAIFTPTTPSAVRGQVTVDAGKFTDKEGNQNLPGAMEPITIDTVAPRVTMSSTPGGTVGLGGTTVTFTIDEPLKPSTSFALADIAVVGGTLSALTQFGNLYTATFTPETDFNGQATITVAAGAFEDVAGNSNVTTPFTLPVDTLAPTVAITTNKLSVGAGQTATITFTLTEPSTDFTSNAITLKESGAGTLSPISGSGTTYTATFTPAIGYSGPATIEVAAGSFTDAAGNQNTGNEQTALAVNTKSPTVAISSSSATLKDGQTAVITFTLSADSATFALGDAVATGGDLSNFNAISPKEYTAIFTMTPGTVTGTGTVTVAAGVFTDSDGNLNLAGAMTPLDIDAVAPIVTITSDVAAVSKGQTATITFDISEFVQAGSFTLTDVSVIGGTLSNLTPVGNGNLFTATFTPTPDFDGIATISIPQGAFTDGVGNGNAASALTPDIDVSTISPKVLIETDTVSVGGPQTALITFTLSEPSTDFAVTDVTVTGGTLSAFTLVSPTLVSPTVYTAIFTPAANSNTSATIVVPEDSFTNADGNGNTASNPVTIAVNTIFPTVTVTSDVTAGTTLAAGDTAVITFTLSVASTDFDASDASAIGGTLSGFTPVSPTVYTAIFTPAASSTTPGGVSVAAGTFTDAVGNFNVVGGLAIPMSIDTEAPTVLITANAATVGRGQTSTITFTLTEAINAGGFTKDDVVATGGVISNFAGSDGLFTATFTPAANYTGPATVSVPAGAFADVVGNSSAAASVTLAVDTVAPSQPTITSVVSDVPLAAGTIANGGSTNDTTPALSGVAEPASVVEIFLNGNLHGATTANGTGAWSYTAGPLAAGTYNFTATSTDAAGNTSVASAPAYNIVVDLTAPVVTARAARTGIYRLGDAVLFDLTFSEPVRVGAGAASPILQISVGTGPAAALRLALYVSGSGSNTLVFRYVVAADDTNDVDGITLLGITSVGPFADPIYDLAGNAANLGGANGTLTNTAANYAFVMPQTPLITKLALQDNSVNAAAGGFTANPRATPVSYFTLEFDVPVPYLGGSIVDGVLDLADFELTRAGAIIANKPYSPTGTTTFGDQTTIVPSGAAPYQRFIVTDMAGLTETTGTYILTFSDIALVEETDLTWIKTIATPGQLTAGITVAPGNAGLRNEKVDFATITFSQIVVNVSVEDFTLTRNGVPVLLDGVSVNQLDDGRTYRIDGLRSRQMIGGSDADGSYRLEVKAGAATDILQLAGGQLIAPAAVAWNYDLEPQVLSVEPLTPTGFRTVGQTIEFQVILSEAAFVIGQPTLSLIIGGNTRQAQYVSGNTTNALVFAYTVVAGELDLDGIAFSATSLAFPGGSTIRDVAGNDIRPQFTPPDISGIRVDSVPPALVSMTPPANGSYKVGDKISFVATFGESMRVTPSTLGAVPRIPIVIGTVTKYADFVGGNETPTLMFEYTVQPGDLDLNGIVASTAISLNGGSITDLAGNNCALTFNTLNTSGVIIDAVAPVVTRFSVPASTPNGSYRFGQDITIEATMSRAVLANSKLAVTLDTGAEVILTAPTTGTLLRVTYTVGAGENSPDLTVASFTDVSVVDTVGNQLGSTIVPTGVNNIAGARAIVIDTITPAIPLIARIADNVMPLIGDVASGGSTNDNTPTISGTAEPLAVITLRAGNSVLGTVTADAGGVWSITPTPLVDGAYALTATAADAAGNISPSSGAYLLVIDTVAPAIPTFGSVVGTIISGRAEAGATVTIRQSSTIIGTATAAGNGDWVCALSLIDGPYTLTATATDAAGNVSQPTLPTNVTIDTVAPAAPVITSVFDDFPESLGTISSGGLTNDATPTVSGTAEPGSVVTLRNGGTTLGTATTNGLGDWSITPSLTSGTYALVATAVDASGNVSPASAIYTIMVDTIPPQTPTITAVADDADPVVGNLMNNGTTNDTTPTVSGTSGPGALVTLKNGSTVLGTTTADGAGRWTITTSALVDGRYSLVASVADQAGNVASSIAFPLTVDTMAPATPIVTGIAGRAGRSANIATPTLTGTAEPGSAIVLRVGPTVIGSGTAHAITGQWSIAVSSLIDGPYDVVATATDAAGNSSVSAAFSIVIDTVAPPAPVITSVDDNVSPVTGPVANGAATNDTTPTVTGTAEAGSIVTLKNGNTTLGTATADAGGQWTFTPSSLAQGTYSLTATATDAAGNTSATSLPFSLTIDTTAPTSPVILGVQDNKPPATGSVTNGGITNDSTPTLNGTADSNVTVTLRAGVIVVGTTTANANGQWSITTSTLFDGVHVLTVTATDGAGNASAASSDFTITVDTVAPLAPVITSVDDNISPVTGPVANGAATNDTTPTVTGTAEAGSIVTLKNGNTTLGTATADAGGQWTFTPSSLAQGTYSLTATATDAAGNVSGASQPYGLSIDTTAPALPSITAAIDDVLQYTGLVTSGGATNDTLPTFTGTAERGALVSLMNGNTVIGTGIADANGQWSITPTTVLSANIVWTLSATATDAAGNVSAVSIPFRLTIDTSAPSAPTIETIESDVLPTVGVVSSGSRTNDHQLRVSGKAEPNGRVTFWVNHGTPRAANIVTTANALGRWALTTPALADGLHSFSALVRDAASNRSGLSAASSVTVDTTAPEVTFVGSQLASGAYGVGQIVDIRVQFSENIQVGGTPMLALMTSPARVATFIEASGDTVTFRYVIAVGDMATKLDYASSTAIMLNGGWIRDLAGNDARLTLAAPGAPGSLGSSKSIAVDASIKATAIGLSTSLAESPSITTRRPTITITFNTPVTGVNLSAIKLFYEGRSVSLTGASVSGSGSTYTLSIPGIATSLRGGYRLRIGGPGSGILAGDVPMNTPTNLYWKRV